MHTADETRKTKLGYCTFYTFFCSECAKAMPWHVYKRVKGR